MFCNNLQKGLAKNTYDENYDTMPYDDYEIIINEASFE
jgi:hypothetical protein